MKYFKSNYLIIHDCAVVLKGYSKLCDCPGLDTSFSHFESPSRNPLHFS